MNISKNKISIKLKKLFLDLVFNYKPKYIFYFIIAINLKELEKSTVSTFIKELYLKIQRKKCETSLYIKRAYVIGYIIII